jgi:cysteine desulfurase/selenocysteine lyase
MPLQVAAHFAALGDTIHLNTAAFGPAPARAAAALREAATAWAEGRFDYAPAERAGEACRAGFASLIGAGAEDIALIPTASAVAGQVAAHLAHAVPPGTLLVGEEEYTSNLFSWRLLERRGFTLRPILHRDGRLLPEDFAAAADASTRLIAVSAVQSATGFRVDLPALRAIADRSGALLYVDAAQIAGAMELDAPALGIDALAAPAHKFLLGTRGMGYAWFAPALRAAMLPAAPGWKAAAEPLASFFGPEMRLSDTASRYDQSLAWFNAMADAESMALLAGLGIAAIHAHNTALVARLAEHLRARGVPFLDHPPGNRSTILSVMPPSPEAARRLQQAGVVASIRAGRVRLAVHLHNTEAQIDRVAALLGAP